MFGCHRLDSRLIFADFLVANGFRMIFSDDTQGATMYVIVLSLCGLGASAPAFTLLDLPRTPLAPPLAPPEPPAAKFHRHFVYMYSP